MNYIGSKLSLLSFIEDTVDDITNGNYYSVCDLFAGTGIVGRHFKKKNKMIISNDIQYYSYVLNRHYIGNNNDFPFLGLYEEIKGLSSAADKKETVCDYLSRLKGKKGYIFSNYCLSGSGERMYYSDENGMLCDSIRDTIDDWKRDKKITEDEYFFLLCSLLESIDKVANTASVYGAFLKSLKKSAQKELIISPAEIIPGQTDNKVLNKDANWVAKHNPVDVLYLDPPYNHRQYATNYHLLETIAKNDKPLVHGKTGLREYSSQKSLYCSRTQVKSVFNDLIANAKAKYIFLSYNNEGLLAINDIKEIMEQRGQYGYATMDYHRFKADSTRDYKADSTIEYLHYVKCK